MREDTAEILLPAPRERRAHKRVKLIARARLTAATGSVVGRCSDVSLGGMAVRGRGPVQVGDVIEVDFEIEGGQVKTRGEVVRRRGTLLGLRFIELDQTSLLALMGYVGAAN